MKKHLNELRVLSLRLWHTRYTPDSMTMLGQRWYRVVRLACGWGWKYYVGPTLPQR